ncbi:caspase-1-like [Daphnia pulicaria]|uniref:caspase-1-like n=1 Tax=Daphnia pulicaria TaxID=35523 RepID=UPI001EEC7556|nr:caspase-1-like [Daphnia pulicaria]
MESDAIANGSELPRESIENEDTTSLANIPGDFPDYDMGHRRRGIACIFNHDKFHQKTWPADRIPSDRPGSSKDRDDLTRTLSQLDFEVESFDNLTAAQVRKEIAKLAEKVDHTDHDCLLVVVMSHGQDGKICAFDTMYDVGDVWMPFSSDQCATLVGKPKLFFIQACRGTLRDCGTEVSYSSTTTDGPGEYSIPTQADFLFVYSTIPGYGSYRSEENGAVFIQVLCDVLSQRGRRDDLISIMTVVLRKVAVEKIRGKDEVKKTIIELCQMPCFISQLIRQVYFPPKPTVSTPAKRRCLS